MCVDLFFVIQNLICIPAEQWSARRKPLRFPLREISERLRKMPTAMHRSVCQFTFHFTGNLQLHLRCGSPQVLINIQYVTKRQTSKILIVRRDSMWSAELHDNDEWTNLINWPMAHERNTTHNRRIASRKWQ